MQRSHLVNNDIMEIRPGQRTIRFDSDYNMFLVNRQLDGDFVLQIEVYKFNPEYELQWVRYFYANNLIDGADSFNDVNFVMDIDNCLIFNTSYFTSNESGVFIFKIDQSGDITWNYLIEFQENNYIGGISMNTTSMGDYLILGYLNNEHFDERYLYMALLNPSYVSVPEASIELPASYYLSAAYPNPFNNETRISYGLASDGRASVKVYDISGRLVATLVDADLNAGNHNVIWNAEGFTTGVYFVKMETANFTETRKVVLMK